MLTESGQMQYLRGGFRKFLAAYPTDIIDHPRDLDSLMASAIEDFWFGVLPYELKDFWQTNQHSKNRAWTASEGVSWFLPSLVIEQVGRSIVLHKGSWPDWSFQSFSADKVVEFPPMAATEKETYLRNVEIIKEWIRQGTTYELNYCLEFVGKVTIGNPLTFYFQLFEHNQAPFSAYYKQGSHFTLCGSPERFLKIENGRLISQPIKGTRPTSIDPQEDEKLKQDLSVSSKDLAENVMIVDLVRNDLARVSETGTVRVEELCGLYSFPSVHQLISTVTSQVKQGSTTLEIMKSLFPMGSMTGAPKIRTMQLIEEVEDFRRGFYSGALGYLLPGGDFDSNVLIRSLFYDSQSDTVRFCAGGAVTLDSIPEEEFEEIETKVRSLKALINS